MSRHKITRRHLHDTRHDTQVLQAKIPLLGAGLCWSATHRDVNEQDPTNIGEGKYFGSSNIVNFPESCPYTVEDDWSWDCYLDTVTACDDMCAAAAGVGGCNHCATTEDGFSSLTFNQGSIDGDDYHDTFYSWYNSSNPINGTHVCIRLYATHSGLVDWIQFNDCWVNFYCDTPQTPPGGHWFGFWTNDKLSATGMSGGVIVNPRTDPFFAEHMADDADKTFTARFATNECNLDDEDYIATYAHHQVYYFDMNASGTQWGEDAGIPKYNASTTTIKHAEINLRATDYHGTNWYIGNLLSPPKQAPIGDFKPSFNKTGNYLNNPMRSLDGDFTERFYDANFFVRGCIPAGLTGGAGGMTFGIGHNAMNWEDFLGVSGALGGEGTTWTVPGGVNQGIDISVGTTSADFNVWDYSTLDAPVFPAYHETNPIISFSKNHRDFTIDVTTIVQDQHNRRGGGVFMMLGLCGDHLIHGCSMGHADWILSHAGCFSILDMRDGSSAVDQFRPHLTITYTP